MEIIENDSRPAKVISMVRDPIARNISAFFENLHAFGLDHEAPTSDLIKTFKERYSHHVPLRWFDRELRDGIGFDIFEQPFDTSTRMSRYSKDRFEILIVRIDADLSVLQREISDFVSAPLELKPENTADSKGYKRAYSKFKEKLSLPRDYVERMYSSTFARHFWTSAERAEMSSLHLGNSSI